MWSVEGGGRRVTNHGTGSPYSGLVVGGVGDSHILSENKELPSYISCSGIDCFLHVITHSPDPHAYRDESSLCL